MSQAERISRIHLLLRAKSVVTLREMKDTFEVSRATLMRDIELMRDRLAVPIAYDARHNGYTLDPRAKTQEYLDALPGVWLTAKEGYAFLTMFNVLRALDPGFLIGILSPMRVALKRLLHTMDYAMWGLDKKIVIDLPGFVSSPQTYLDPMFSALITEQVALLTWLDPKGDEQSGLCKVTRLTLRRNGWWFTVAPETGPPVEVPTSAILRCRCDEVTRSP